MWAEGGGCNEWQSYVFMNASTEIWQQMQVQTYSEVTCDSVQWSDPLERIALVDSLSSMFVYCMLLAKQTFDCRNTHWANDPGWKTESAALD